MNYPQIFHAQVPSFPLSFLFSPTSMIRLSSLSESGDIYEFASESAEDDQLISTKLIQV